MTNKVHEVMNKNGKWIVVDTVGMENVDSLQNEKLKNKFHKDELYIICKCNSESQARSVANAMDFVLEVAMGPKYKEAVKVLFSIIFDPLKKVPNTSETNEEDEEKAKDIVDTFIKGLYGNAGGEFKK